MSHGEGLPDGRAIDPVQLLNDMVDHADIVHMPHGNGAVLVMPLDRQLWDRLMAFAEAQDPDFEPDADGEPAPEEASEQPAALPAEIVRAMRLKGCWRPVR